MLILSTVTHLRKPYPFPFRDNACIFVYCACAHGLAVSSHRCRMSSSAEEMDFSCFTKQCSIYTTVRREIFQAAKAYQQQGFPLTDRTVWVSSVKNILHIDGSVCISLCLSETHSHTAVPFFFCRSSLLNSGSLQCGYCCTKAHSTLETCYQVPCFLKCLTLFFLTHT